MTGERGLRRASVGASGMRPIRAPAAASSWGFALVPAVLAGACLALSAVAGRTALTLTLALVLVWVVIVSLDLASVALLIGGLFLVQPFALGAGHTILGSGIACAGGLAALVSDAIAVHGLADKATKSVLLWVTLSAAWTVGLATQHSGLDLGAAERTCEALFAVLTSAVLILRSSKRRLWFARGMVLVMAAFSLSYAVTFLLWLKDGFGSHVVGSISIRGYNTEPVYLPFTPTSGSSLVAGRVIPRLLGPLREPGLCQALLIWSFFMLERIGMRRRWLQAVLVGGVLATQSTAGLGIFLVVGVLVSMMGDSESGRARGSLRHFGGLVVLVGALYVAVFAPTIGVAAKQTSNAASIGDRWTNTRAGLTALVEAPFGRDETSYQDNVAINLLASTTLVGAPGLILGLTAFLRPITLAGRRKDALAAGLPLFLTALVAQPVMDAPAFFVVFMAGLATFPTELRRQAAVDEPVTAEARPVPRLQPV